MQSENLFPHLWRHVCELEEKRRAAWAAMRTAEDVMARARWIRETVGRMNGPFPPRCDLNPRITKTLERDDYTAESLIFDSRPGFPVTATLYLPKRGERPLPAVLSPCGHSANGRMYEVYQRAHVGLCKAGFAVLSYDPVSQGERVQYLDADGKPILDNCCHEHCMAGNQLNLTGSNMANIRVWDGIRAFDYLATRPEVDCSRVAVAGNSGGGTLSTHLLCLEGRLAAGAPNCFITTLVHRIATRMAADSEQQFLPMLREGIDHADLLLAAAPAPILVCARSQDFFPLEGAQQTVAELQAAYALLGCPERVELCVDEGDHHWSKALREGGVRWFRRFLCGSDEPYEEPDFPVEEDATLWATATGNVLTAGLGAIEVHAVALRDAPPALACRAAADPVAAVRRKLPELLGIDPAAARRPWPMPEYMRVPEAPPPGPAGVRTQWVEFLSDFDVRITGLLFTPEQATGQAVLMAPDEEGIAPLLARGSRAYEAALAGETVLAVDPRGVGRHVGAAPARAAVSGYYSFYGLEVDLTYTSWMIGKPILGMRVYDLLSAAHWLRERGLVTARVEGDGAGGMLALLAGALDPEIGEVTSRGMPLSWEMLFRTPIYDYLPNLFLPESLQWLDLPDVAATLAPRPFSLLAPLDARRRPVGAAALEAAYQVCRDAYEAAGAGGRLCLSAAADVR